MDTPHTLELSADQMDQLVNAAMLRIHELIRTLPEQPLDTSGNIDADALKKMVEPLPELGSDLDPLIDLIFDRAKQASLNPISPGFMGYVPGGGLFHAAVADLISDTLNRYVGVAAVAPALSQIEGNVIRWFCQIMGYPDSARGFLTSGGSLATLSALTTARQTCLGEDFSKGVIYVSDQAHHCIAKAARLAGFPVANVRILPCDSQFRLNPDQVRQKIAEDRALGLKPFLVAASAGTTNTGAIDPLPELAKLAREEGLWFHVDAAYGGFFCLTERGRVVMQGINEADSIVLDPHKTLFLPYGTGALLVRDGNTLKQTHSSEADYMPHMQGDNELMDFCELSPELTRPFRGLRVWLPLKLHGAGVFRQYLDEKLDLARWIEQEIRKIPQLEIAAPPELSILAFSVSEGQHSIAERNELTRRLINGINKRQRVHLTGTLLKGVFAIRIAVIVFRLHQDRMEMLLEDLQAELDSLLTE
jgi:aromatic-L-amino-acid decarboxylase